MRATPIVTAILWTVLLGACGQAGEPGGAKGRVGEAAFPAIDCSDYWECQDGVWCNGVEYCGCFGGVCGRCLPGYRQVCDDGNPCTADNCINDYLGTAGSPGVPGEIGTGHCQHRQICEFCLVVEDCDDDDACTTDTCEADNRCLHVGADCDDADFCTLDTCDSSTGLCGHDPIPLCCHLDTDCDDANTCTLDTCNTVTHGCVFAANTGAACVYPSDACFDPGMCRSDGLCGPGSRNTPSNDTCSGPIDIVLDGTGEALVEGSTSCARDDYSSTCGGGGNTDVVYRFAYQVGNDFQLYSHDIVLDADYNGLLYAQSGCGSTLTEIICNDNCTSNPMITCDTYGLGLLDSAFNLPPGPVGSMYVAYLGVDGIGGARGAFHLAVHRISHTNNPCYTTADTGRRIDATYGGEYRGNINGYINDILDASHAWVKTPCHAAAAAGADWPGNAWFSLHPPLTTTYCVWTDEATPASWFDTVISVWDGTMPSYSGCGAVKRYLDCAYLAGQNGSITPTQTEIVVPGNATYMVGISSYARPTSGNYAVHFDIGACGESCTDQGGKVYNNHCYIQLMAPRDWTAARAACSLWGGHLVSINDSAENTFVRTNFAAVSADSPWIGIHDSNTEGTWEWVNGDPVAYTNWSAGQPDDAGGAQDWGQMLTAGTWADCGPACGTRSCICEKP
jgi:hypothetical protein